MCRSRPNPLNSPAHSEGSHIPLISRKRKNPPTRVVRNKTGFYALCDSPVMLAELIETCNAVDDVVERELEAELDD